MNKLTHKVIIFSNGVESNLYRGTKKECQDFCDFYNFEYIDENEFQWNMEIVSIDGQSSKQYKATATNQETKQVLNVVGDYNSKQEFKDELEFNGYIVSMSDIKEI